MYAVLHARQNRIRLCGYDRPCGVPLARRKYKGSSDYSNRHHGRAATTSSKAASVYMESTAPRWPSLPWTDCTKGFMVRLDLPLPG